MIICDRGGMDVKVFTTDEQQWVNILKGLATTESAIQKRYDCIIQLKMAPR